MQASSDQVAAFRYGVVSAFTLLLKARCITDTVVLAQIASFSAADLRVYDIDMFEELLDLLSSQDDPNLLAASMQVVFAHRQLPETTKNA